MAWTAPATVITGDLLTAALWNAQVRDNMLETAAATAAAAGDLIYADAANSMGGRLAAAGNGGKYLRFNTGATAVEAAAVPSAPIGALNWQDTLATLYAAYFGSGNIINDTEVGDIYNAGWEQNGSPTIVNGSGAGTGDFNAADDDEPSHLNLGTAAMRIHSPAIIGGYTRLRAVEALLGQAPTTITIGMLVRATNANTDATGGFGIASQRAADMASLAGTVAIVPGAVNWSYMVDGAAAVSLGVAKDQEWSDWEIVITVSNGQMAIKRRGATLASGIAAPATDRWPKSFYANHTATAGLPYKVAGVYVKYE